MPKPGQVSTATFRYISKAARKKMDPSHFAGPDLTFPIETRADVGAAVARLNSIPSSNRPSVKSGIIRCAKMMGFEDALPASWGAGKKGKPKSHATMSDLSFSDIQSLLQEAIEEAEGIDDESLQETRHIWVRDTFPSSVVYCIGYSSDDMYRRSYVIDDSDTVTLGDRTEVTRKTSYQPVAETAAMSLGEALFSKEEGDWVVYEGAKLFEAGEYPEWNLQVQPEDLLSMVHNFEPLKGDLEHIFARTPSDKLGNLSALRGELTELRSIDVDASDPNILRGTVAVRKWLDPKLEGRGVSVEIPIENPTRLSGYTLTTKPRVQGAALMSSLMSELQSHANPNKEHPKMDETQTKALTALAEALTKNPALLSQLTSPTTVVGGVPSVPGVDQRSVEAAVRAQMEPINAKAREDASVAMFSATISPLVGKKLTPAQVNSVRDLYVAARVIAASDDARPENKPNVALFDAEAKAAKPVESRVALFDQLISNLVGSMSSLSIQPGEGWKGDFHVIHSATPLKDQQALFGGGELDPEETPEALDKWEAAITANELARKGITTNTNSNGRG